MKKSRTLCTRSMDSMPSSVTVSTSTGHSKILDIQSEFLFHFLKYNFVFPCEMLYFFYHLLFTYFYFRCKKQLYYEDLPTASIVVPFHNEHFSVLLRTAYSALNRAPANLLEVILVDDASTKGNFHKLANRLFWLNLIIFCSCVMQSTVRNL